MFTHKGREMCIPERSIIINKETVFPKEQFREDCPSAYVRRAMPSRVERQAGGRSWRAMLKQTKE